MTNCSNDRLVMGTPMFRVDLLEPGTDVRVIGILVSSDYISRDSEVRCNLFRP